MLLKGDFSLTNFCDRTGTTCCSLNKFLPPLQIENLEAEVKTLKEVGAGGFYQTMPLPEGMAVTSADVIASLNEHLVQALQVG